MVAKLVRWLRLALVLAALSGLRAVGVAWSHAGYELSEPGAGAIVGTAPGRVDIWFSQDLFRRQGENWVRVTNPAGEAVHVGEAAIDDDDRRRMFVVLQPDLAPGVYTVAWHTLSAEDGDEEEGTFAFNFDPDAQVTSTPMQAATATGLPPTAAVAPVTPTPAATPAGSGGCGAALLAPALVLGAAGVSRRRRRRER